MRPIVFIDTSVLCNLVPVPGRDQRRDAVIAEMKIRKGCGEHFILPITSVVETGNFVAQIADGAARRATALRLEKMLRLICEEKAPWVLHDVAWNRGFLERFLDGGGTGVDYVGHAQSRLGAGDLCILTERQHYCSRTGIAADIWTLDAGLNAHR